jgi:hypothetical protein
VQRLAQIVDRAGERREVEYVVDGTFDLDVLDDVVVDEQEVVAADVLEVLERARLEVVDAEHAVALREEVIAEMGAEEPGSARDDAGTHRGNASPATFGAC